MSFGLSNSPDDGVDGRVLGSVGKLLNLKSLLAGDRDDYEKDFPKFKNINTENYAGLTDPNKKPYSLLVIDGSGEQTQPNPGQLTQSLSPNPEIKLQYDFAINPQRETISEPAAVNITPMQDGGKFIEHQGQVFKDIVISGTTGYYPQPARSATSISQSQRRGPPSLPHSGIGSGFESFVVMRYFFRRYWGMKRYKANHQAIEMCYLNRKDGELWVVEPLVFQADRDSKSPFLYRYSITLKTIRPYDSPPKSFLDRFLEPVSFALNAADKVTAIIADGATGVQEAAQDVQGLIVGLERKVLGPIQNLSDALVAFVQAKNTVLGIPQDALKELNDTINSVRGQLDFARSGNLANGPIDRADNALSKIQDGANRILSNPKIFYQSPTSSKSNGVRSVFNRRPAGGSVGLSLAEVHGTSTANVFPNDSLQDIAFRTLGDATRWPDLVVINGLKQPFIDPTPISTTAPRVPGVLRPGDTIQYPKQTISDSSSPLDTGIQVINETFETKQESPTERKLGVDLLLDRDTGDIQINTQGDIALVSGMDNAVQALRLKFTTRRGTLRGNPYFGLAVPIGKKKNDIDLVFLQSDIRRQVKLDPRFEDVKDMQVKLERDVFRINANVMVRNAQDVAQIEGAALPV